MNQTCETCHHWDKNNAPKPLLGTCQRISKSNNAPYITFDRGKDEELITPSDFGCSLWAKKINRLESAIECLRTTSISTNPMMFPPEIAKTLLDAITIYEDALDAISSNDVPNPPLIAQTALNKAKELK